MLAFLAGWAAIRNRCDEARLPALALVALPAGAVVAAVRTDADPHYLLALGLLTGAGALARYGVARLVEAEGPEARDLDAREHAPTLV
jgi:hypothetical protein